MIGPPHSVAAKGWVPSSARACAGDAVACREQPPPSGRPRTRAHREGEGWWGLTLFTRLGGRAESEAANAYLCGGRNVSVS